VTKVATLAPDPEVTNVLLATIASAWMTPHHTESVHVKPAKARLTSRAESVQSAIKLATHASDLGRLTALAATVAHQ
jgi:hypothetical protein